MTAIHDTTNPAMLPELLESLNLNGVAARDHFNDLAAEFFAPYPRPSDRQIYVHHIYWVSLEARRVVKPAHIQSYGIEFPFDDLPCIATLRMKGDPQAYQGVQTFEAAALTIAVIRYRLATAK
jgi:hypothetical protein